MALKRLSRKDKSTYCVVLTTTPTLKEARKLAGLLLSSRLAACINILPGVESHYVWKEKKRRSPELLLLIKTRKALFQRLEACILRHHSYETPEIISLPITAGTESYLSWISAQTSI